MGTLELIVLFPLVKMTVLEMASVMVRLEPVLAPLTMSVMLVRSTTPLEKLLSSISPLTALASVMASPLELLLELAWVCILFYYLCTFVFLFIFFSRLLFLGSCYWYAFGCLPRYSMVGCSQKEEGC